MYKYLLCFSSSTPSPGVFYKMHAFERRMSVYPCGQTTCNNPISTNPTLTRSRSRSPVAIRSLCSYQVPAFEKVCTEQHVFWPSAASPGNVSRGAQVEIVCFFYGFLSHARLACMVLYGLELPCLQCLSAPDVSALPGFPHACEVPESFVPDGNSCAVKSCFALHRQCIECSRGKTWKYVLNDRWQVSPQLLRQNARAILLAH